MSIYAAFSLFAVMAAMAAIPSASVALVVVRASSQGVASGLAVASGIVVADLVFVVLALLGMSVVAEALGSFFVLVKLVAALFLIGFGLSLLIKKKTQVVVAEGSSASRGLLISFVSGFLLTLGDIKAIVFYASLLPVFVDLTALVPMDMTIIAMMTVVSVGGVKAIYALCAGSLSAHTVNSKVQIAARKFVGGLLVASGAYLIVKP